MHRQQSSRSIASNTSQPPLTPPTPQQPSVNNKLEVIKESQRNVKSNAPMAPIQVTMNSDTLSKWIMTSQIKPQSEVTLASMPLFLATYGNLLFTMDQTSFLSIYEKVFSVELKLKNSVKLNMPNIKRLLAN